VHELSLCGAIADIASHRAGHRRVVAVHVRIGELRQVVPDTLSFCWAMTTEGTELDGAALEVERVAARLRCRECGTDFGLVPYGALACTSCGGLAPEVLAGEELDVAALDLVEA
jgi:hydrogenase nickel incorporation protein HypA/HybF